MPNALEPHRQCGGGRGGRGGKFLERDLTRVPGLNERPVRLGQLLHALFERRPPGRCRGIRVLAGRGDPFEQGRAQARPPALAAKMAEDLVASEGVGPGQKRPARVELIPLLPEEKAGLLVDVVEFDLVGQERGDESLDLPLVPQEHGHEVVRR